MQGGQSSVLERIRIGWQQLTKSTTFHLSKEGGYVASRLPGDQGLVVRTMEGKCYWVPGVLPDAEMDKFHKQYSLAYTPAHAIAKFAAQPKLVYPPPKELTEFRNQYGLQPDGMIAQGAFGSVKVGIPLDTTDPHRFVAVKVTDASANIGDEAYMQASEWTAWTRVPPTAPVIQRLGAARIAATHYLIGEVAAYGTMAEMIAKLRLPNPPGICGSDNADMLRQRLAHEMLRTVRAFHEEGIYHRDIKPENLIIDDSGRIKLIDLATCTWTASAATGFTENYAQPYDPNNTAQSGDIYALGRTFFMLSRTYHEAYRPPFDQPSLDPSSTNTLHGCAKRMMAILKLRPEKLEEVAQFEFFQQPLLSDEAYNNMLYSMAFPGERKPQGSSATPA